MKRKFKIEKTYNFIQLKPHDEDEFYEEFEVLEEIVTEDGEIEWVNVDFADTYEEAVKIIKKEIEQE